MAKTRLAAKVIRWAALAACLAPSVAVGQGLAGQYPYDEGIATDPSVLWFLDFNDQQATQAWHGGQTGYGWTDAPENVFAGPGALAIQQLEGTHHPSETYNALSPSDVVFVRWYRKWQDGYDWTQHKMPGAFAKVPGAPPGGGAGIPPNGYDKYSCKLYVDWNRVPRFYTYHPEQAGDYGDGLLPNLVDPAEVALQAGQWYCFEMMLKANNAPSRDGELKMWVDGQLVGHYQDMRFRDTNDLKINWFCYSAYVGGTWVSQQDQKLWDDQIVVATEYIGPMSTDPTPRVYDHVGYSVRYVGDGLYGVSFEVHADDGQPSTFAAEMTFQGIHGGQIQQMACDPAGLNLRVDTESLAEALHGLGSPPYDRHRDSYVLDPFAENILEVAEGDNSYWLAATTGASPSARADLAYIVTTGNVAFSGVIWQGTTEHPVGGAVVLPLPGDANYDEAVDGGDYTIWADSYQQAERGWGGGDFNGDGVVDGGDYTIWADHFAPGGAPVPELNASVLLACAAAGLLRRRRRCTP